MAEVFHAAVHGAAAAHYTAAQRAAWSPAPRPEIFADREADGRMVFVADSGGVTGFIELERDGHIDCFYTHPRGAGPALYDALEEAARTLGLSALFVEASETARPFFEARGFVVEQRREVERQGVELHNYRMSMALG
ncbi:GNAT family N-acetyltransferase [Maritimibacter dapengensis]|uniref:GNAT family N-acetyltransferase n=1 Tax=Maritimibacter dapengensis TaxID=2836868 RepID=UPI002101FCE7|nr:GNAT family N-acetyltransferase [Maritimibacter dapengensis]